MILGIDPANDGAAVLIDSDGIVISVWSWKQVTRKKQKVWKLLQSNHQSEVDRMITANIVDIALYIGELMPDGVEIACEAPYVNKRFPKSGLDVARVGGMLVGGVIGKMEGSPSSHVYVMASDWRYQLLRLNPFTQRADCKRVSLHDIPLMCKSITPHLDAHGRLDHITDALGVALWHRMKLQGWKTWQK